MSDSPPLSRAWSKICDGEPALTVLRIGQRVTWSERYPRLRVRFGTMCGSLESHPQIAVIEVSPGVFCRVLYRELEAAS